MYIKKSLKLIFSKITWISSLGVIKEIPSLNSWVAIQQSVVRNGARPIKEAQSIFRVDLDPLIAMIIQVDFIRKFNYPTWFSSIVPLTKKNSQIRDYVEFRYPNNVLPKWVSFYHYWVDDWCYMSLLGHVIYGLFIQL